MVELESILEELEGDDLDIDVLAERVKRASELIKMCRAKIARAHTDVERIVADLDSLPSHLPGDETGDVGGDDVGGDGQSEDRVEDGAEREVGGES
jgi:exodeoxyribonuclease VII small subunit